MSRVGTVSKTVLKLQETSWHTSGLQLALQRWRLCSASRVSFSAKANDDDDGEAATGTDRGSWRSWVEQQLSGIDKAALNEQQQVVARQLQKQQQQAEQPPTQPQTLQQSAQADAEEELTGSGTENQSPASLHLSSSQNQPGGDADLAVPDAAPDVLEQSVSELSAAQPDEPETQTQESVPAVETDASPQLAHASDLPVDERIDVFLKAIRDRSWEHTSRQAVKRAEGDEDSLKLPPSGYSELGSVSQGRFQGQMLNPARTFFPGQSYNPEDLLADASPGAPAQQTTGPAAITNQPFTNREVLQAADFKNLHFLNAFVSDGGQILSRNKTKLQAKVHRHLARQIKTARIMALLPHSGRAEEFQQGTDDLSDDDFDPDGEIDDSAPGYRRRMQNVSE
ncbi:TPA: hypothetical protein ACH3X2_011661 [Trebouxia sp. C0005]